MPVKQGPLTLAEIEAVWKGAVDASYSEPLQHAGEGNGYEAWTQAFRQTQRVSEAIDRTTQAMYLQPWSGQTDEPASGARYATVTLTFERKLRVNFPVVLGKGTVLVEEELLDWEDTAGLLVRTGRRYALTENLVFHAGDSGPFTVVAEAERPGYGYNNPLPGTLKVMTQPGSGFYNNLGSVTLTPGNATDDALAYLVTANKPDMFIPDQVGQYVLFTSGTNIGKLTRILHYFDPVPPNQGSKVLLELVVDVEATTFTGTFEQGEDVTLSGGGRGTILGERIDGGKKKIAFTRDLGTVAIGTTMTGVVSGATATVSFVLYDVSIAAETATAEWRVPDWHTELGFAVTNVSSPEGGKSPFLDEIGDERKLPRLPGEDDESYRGRISKVADVVSPNAIKRALFRETPDGPACVREVGLEFFPGLYLDVDAFDTKVRVFTGVRVGTTVDNEPVEIRDPAGNVKLRGWFSKPFSSATVAIVITRQWPYAAIINASDTLVGTVTGFSYTTLVPVTDPVSVKTNRWRLLLDYTDFRAFMMIGVPRTITGEYGFSYDNHPRGAFDVTGLLNAYDGYPAASAIKNRRIHDAVDRVRAGAVGFNLFIDEGDCT